VKVKLKGDLIPVRIMNACRGSRSTAPLLLNLDITTGVLLISRSSHYTPEVEHRYPLYRRPCGPKGRYGWFQNVNSLFPAHIRSTHRQPLDSPYIHDAIPAPAYV